MLNFYSGKLLRFKSFLRYEILFRYSHYIKQMSYGYTSYRFIISFLLVLSVIGPFTNKIMNSSPVVAYASSHLIPPVKSVTGISKQATIVDNSSRNHSIHQEHKKSIRRSKSKIDRRLFLKAPQFLQRTLKSIVGSAYFRVSSIYKRIRHKSIRNRELAKKSVLDAADAMINVTKLITHCQSDDSNITPYDDLNTDVALALSYLSKDDETFWQFINEEQEIKVWKTHAPLCDDKTDKKWVCIMAKTEIDASPTKLLKLLLDSEKVALLNRYSYGRNDIEIINPHCKIVWNRSRIPFTIKPFDFCTLIQDYRDPKTGMILVISRAVEHPIVPVRSDYARSHVIFGLNVLIPNPDDPNRTQYISINHVKYGGIYSAFASSGAYQGTINYLSQLKQIAPDLVK